MIGIIEDFDTWKTFDKTVWRTKAYEYTQFEPPAVELAPPHVDYGVDTDNDDLYDKLVIDVNLNVRRAGRYKLLGVLMGSFGEPLDRVVKELYLEVGTGKVERLEFEGWKIYSAHIEGRMAVAILLLDPDVGELVWAEVGGIRHPLSGWTDMDLHPTKIYSYDQFQPTAPKYSALFVGMPVRIHRAGEIVTPDLPELPTLEEVRLIAEENDVTSKVSVFEGVENIPEVPEVPGVLITHIIIEVENARGQSFVIKLSWERVEELGIDLETLEVYRFGENWEEVEVEEIDEDENYVYFEVTPPGFSLFAVTAQPLPEVPAQPAAVPTTPIVHPPPLYLVIITALILVSRPL
jgi:hypothetical protein